MTKSGNRWQVTGGRSPAAKRHASWIKRLRAAHPLAHAALVFGCLLFGFPFFWLLTTSMKDQREVFSDPPKWIPTMPPAGLTSPYIAQDEYREPTPPPGVEAKIWRLQWPQIQTYLWGESYSRLAMAKVVSSSELRPYLFSSPHVAILQAKRELLDPLTRGVWERVAATTPPERLRSIVQRPIRLAGWGVVTEEMCSTVWERIHKALELRRPTIQDKGYQTYVLANLIHSTGAPDYPFQEVRWWRHGKAAVLDYTSTTKEPTLRVNYDFHRGNKAVLFFVSNMPVQPSKFLRITVPLKPDRSYHRVNATVSVGGQLYRSKRPLLLDTDLWQEASWQVETHEEEGTLFKDYIPLIAAGKSKGSSETIAIDLTIERNSRLRAAYDKALRNYRAALQYLPLTKYLWNTLLLVFFTVLGELAACSMVAYSFARLQWPGRDVLFALLLATMMLPGQVTMIPVFLIFKHLGWYNTLKPLWIGSFFGNAFFIFMLRQFMRTIPKDLEEAARIDGCGYFGCYWRIILPLLKPALAAVGIFTFMNTWNNFMGPLIYLNDQRLYPLSLGLFQFRLEHSTDFGMLMSASTLMTLPVVAVFFVAQKHFIQGVTLTGMKG
ncbi:MAG: carbohydrate ABC transporter permease [Armatimonadetes bacterium]|nr:carbohydrate ABC transporter permease [Armatimonadota bacterium]